MTDHGMDRPLAWLRRLLESLEQSVSERGGAGRIGTERLRQIADERYSADYDDAVHADGKLVIAAGVYMGLLPLEAWPGRHDRYKPRDRISNLVRAGALIAAEIDRLQRQAASEAAEGHGNE